MLLVLLAATAALRGWGLSRPLVGNFATKNVLYATIARNWIRDVAPLWRPTLDCLTGGERSVYLMEFPVSAYLTGLLWATYGGTLEIWGRMTSLAFSVISVGLLYALVRRWHGTTAALVAGAALAISPVGIVFGQSFLLQSSVVCFSLLTFWALEHWLEVRQHRWLVLVAASWSLLLLSKIYLIVLLLPLAVRVAQAVGPWAGQESPPGDSRLNPQRGPGLSRPMALLAAMALMVGLIPAVVWNLYVLQAASPTGPWATRLYYSLRDSVGAHGVPHPLLYSPHYYLRVVVDLGTVVLTPVGFVLAVMGVRHPGWRRHAAWLLSVAVLLLLLPRKFYEMNYYYVAVLPPLCVMVGLGGHWLAQRMRPGIAFCGGVAVVAISCALAFSVRPGFITPPADRAVTAAAAHVQQLTESNERVATMHGSTFDLLYYCDRAGWPLAPWNADLPGRLNDCRRQGARLLVVAGMQQVTDHPACERLLESLPVVASGKDYRIYRLVEVPVAEAVGLDFDRGDNKGLTDTDPADAVSEDTAPAEDPAADVPLARQARRPDSDGERAVPQINRPQSPGIR
jgi:4-amino-4-deoxy-L-arabinose transferase-like glycosyltransferase